MSSSAKVSPQDIVRAHIDIFDMDIYQKHYGKTIKGKKSPVSTYSGFIKGLKTMRNQPDEFDLNSMNNILEVCRAIIDFYKNNEYIVTRRNPTIALPTKDRLAKLEKLYFKVSLLAFFKGKIEQEKREYVISIKEGSE